MIKIFKIDEKVISIKTSRFKKGISPKVIQLVTVIWCDHYVNFKKGVGKEAISFFKTEYKSLYFLING